MNNTSSKSNYEIRPLSGQDVHKFTSCKFVMDTSSVNSDPQQDYLGHHWKVSQFVKHFMKSKDFNPNDQFTQNLCKIALACAEEPNNVKKFSEGEKIIAVSYFNYNNTSTNRKNDVNRNFYSDAENIADSISIGADIVALCAKDPRIVAAADVTSITFDAISFGAREMREQIPANVTITKEQLELFGPDFIERFIKPYSHIEISDSGKEYISNMSEQNKSSDPGGNINHVSSMNINEITAIGNKNIHNHLSPGVHPAPAAKNDSETIATSSYISEESSSLQKIISDVIDSTDDPATLEELKNELNQLETVTIEINDTISSEQEKFNKNPIALKIAQGADRLAKGIYNCLQAKFASQREKEEIEKFEEEFKHRHQERESIKLESFKGKTLQQIQSEISRTLHDLVKSNFGEREKLFKKLIEKNSSLRQMIENHEKDIKNYDAKKEKIYQQQLQIIQQYFKTSHTQFLSYASAGIDFFSAYLPDTAGAMAKSVLTILDIIQLRKQKKREKRINEGQAKLNKLQNREDKYDVMANRADNQIDVKQTELQANRHFTYSNQDVVDPDAVLKTLKDEKDQIGEKKKKIGGEISQKKDRQKELEQKKDSPVLDVRGNQQKDKKTGKPKTKNLLTAEEILELDKLDQDIGPMKQEVGPTGERKNLGLLGEQEKDLGEREKALTADIKSEEELHSIRKNIYDRRRERFESDARSLNVDTTTGLEGLSEEQRKEEIERRQNVALKNRNLMLLAYQETVEAIAQQNKDYHELISHTSQLVNTCSLFFDENKEHDWRLPTPSRLNKALCIIQTAMHLIELEQEIAGKIKNSEVENDKDEGITYVINCLCNGYKNLGFAHMVGQFLNPTIGGLNQFISLVATLFDVKNLKEKERQEKIFTEKRKYFNDAFGFINKQIIQVGELITDFDRKFVEEARQNERRIQQNAKFAEASSNNNLAAAGKNFHATTSIPYQTFSDSINAIKSNINVAAALFPIKNFTTQNEEKLIQSLKLLKAYAENISTEFYTGIHLAEHFILSKQVEEAYNFIGKIHSDIQKINKESNKVKSPPNYTLIKCIIESMYELFENVKKNHPQDHFRPHFKANGLYPTIENCYTDIENKYTEIATFITYLINDSQWMKNICEQISVSYKKLTQNIEEEIRTFQNSLAEIEAIEKSPIKMEEIKKQILDNLAGPDKFLFANLLGSNFSSQIEEPYWIPDNFKANSNGLVSMISTLPKGYPYTSMHMNAVLMIDSPSTELESQKQSIKTMRGNHSLLNLIKNQSVGALIPFLRTREAEKLTLSDIGYYLARALSFMTSSDGYQAFESQGDAGISPEFGLLYYCIKSKTIKHYSTHTTPDTEECILKKTTSVFQCVHFSGTCNPYEKVSSPLKIFIRKNGYMMIENEKGDTNYLSPVKLSTLSCEAPQKDIYSEGYLKAHQQTIETYFAEIKDPSKNNVLLIESENPQVHPLPLVLKSDYMKKVNEFPLIKNTLAANDFGIGTVYQTYSLSLRSFLNKKNKYCLTIHYKFRDTNHKILNLIDVTIDEFDQCVVEAYKKLNVKNDDSYEHKLNVSEFLIQSLAGTKNEYKDYPVKGSFDLSDDGRIVVKGGKFIGLTKIKEKLSKIPSFETFTYDIDLYDADINEKMTQWVESDADEIPQELKPFFHSLSIYYHGSYLTFIKDLDSSHNTLYQSMIGNKSFESNLKEYETLFATLVSGLRLISQMDTKSIYGYLENELQIIHPNKIKRFGQKKEENTISKGKIIQFVSEMQDRSKVKISPSQVFEFHQLAVRCESQMRFELGKLRKQLDSCRQIIGVVKKDDLEHKSNLNIFV